MCVDKQYDHIGESAAVFIGNGMYIGMYVDPGKWGMARHCRRYVFLPCCVNPNGQTAKSVCAY